MDKIVTYQSPEYYELLALGWIVLMQVSTSTVMMAHPSGTVYVNPAGQPESRADPNKWAPYIGCRGVSPFVLPLPTDPAWTVLDQFKENSFTTWRESSGSNGTWRVEKFTGWWGHETTVYPSFALADAAFESHRP